MKPVDNPLLDFSGIPRFDLIKPEHIEPAVMKILKESESKLEHLEKHLEPTWEGLITPLEDIGYPFDYVWAPVGHLLNVKNSLELREAHQMMQPKIVEFGLRLGQSHHIYNGLTEIREGSEWGRLDSAQKRVIELKIRDAKHSGVGLSGEAKNRFNEISKELSKLSTEFMNNVLDAIKAYEFIVTEKKETDDWPDNLLQLTSQSYNLEKKTDESTPEKGPWRITLDAPVIVPFLKHSKNREHREKLYRAYLSRADSGDWDNQPLIDKILLLRKELAGLLGFDCFAELSLDSKMAPSVAAVFDMLDELYRASRPHQMEEFNKLKHIASDGGQVESINHWDTAFWSERLKEKQFNFTDDELRPYFPIPKVLDGLFKLSENLFRVTIKEAPDEAPLWHPDVKYYKVFEGEEQVASFYTDLYSRPSEKRGGAWMGSCLDRRVVDGKLRLPVVYLNANGTPPVGDRPSLMSFDEVTTIFHEFGHCLQGMLTTVDIAEVSGINGVEWDAVEICSQFMENWCYHEPILRTISGHWETGEPLPDHYVEKLMETRTFLAGSAMVRQLEFGLTDMTLHSRFDPEGEKTAFDIHKEIALKTKPIPPLKEDHFLCAFSHIFAGGYAAGYYSYKWAEVLSADIFSAFEEVGLDNNTEIQRLGKRFRDSFLALGGSVEPMKLFKEYMGREPSTEALLKHSGLLE